MTSGPTRRWSVRRTAVALAALMIACSGCDDGKPSVSASTTEAKVTGTVTFKGKRLSEGEVIFDPSNHLRKMEPPRTAPIDKDGRYEINTLVGMNLVSVRLKSSPGLSGDRINFEVGTGENTLDVVLPLPEE